jgi:hypothetical protein
MTTTSPEVINYQPTISDHGILTDLSCGKTRAVINISVHGVSVYVQNAAHKAWGGPGKHYRDKAEALANYKSDAMRKIIEAADKINA